MVPRKRRRTLCSPRGGQNDRLSDGDSTCIGQKSRSWQRVAMGRVLVALLLACFLEACLGRSRGLPGHLGGTVPDGLPLPSSSSARFAHQCAALVHPCRVQRLRGGEDAVVSFDSPGDEDALEVHPGLHRILWRAAVLGVVFSVPLWTAPIALIVPIFRRLVWCVPALRNPPAVPALLAPRTLLAKRRARGFAGEGTASWRTRSGSLGRPSSSGGSGRRCGRTCSRRRCATCSRGSTRARRCMRGSTRGRRWRRRSERRSRSASTRSTPCRLPRAPSPRSTRPSSTAAMSLSRQNPNSTHPPDLGAQ